MNLLMLILYVATSMVLASAIMYVVYRVVSRSQRPTPEKTKVYACGEDYTPERASASDINLYTAVWRLSFRNLYKYVREKGHTGVLSDWFFWMYLFMILALVVLYLVSVTMW